MFLQGIAGTLELFHLSLVRFQQVVGEITGHPVAVYQRIDQAGQKLPLDERVLDDTDTLMVFGLDHLVTEQEAAPEEIEALRQFLTREGTLPDPRAAPRRRRVDRPEGARHGVRASRRSARAASAALRPLHAIAHERARRAGRESLRPSPGDGRGDQPLQPLTIASDLDTRGWLEGVTTFNFHPHLPHYAVTTDDASAIHVLARQPIDLSRPHPFTEAGNREFNMFLWMPPSGERAGDILLADSTIFTTLFGGDESLERFWKNIATK